MKIKDILGYIKSDAYRYCGSCKVADILKLYIRNVFFRYLFWLRMSKSNAKIISIIAKVFKSHLSIKTGIQISSSVSIGHGLFIPHGYVVINASAIIGNNCNLCQFTTVGSINKKAAKLGDNVYVSPNTCIVESVNIDDNVIIGAGSVVVKDVAANCIVAGVPIRVLSKIDDTNKFIKNKFLEF